MGEGPACIVDKDVQPATQELYTFPDYCSAPFQLQQAGQTMILMRHCEISITEVRLALFLLQAADVLCHKVVLSRHEQNGL